MTDGFGRTDLYNYRDIKKADHHDLDI